MIIAKEQNDVEKIGFETSKKATINQAEMAKLQYLLTKGLYSDPVSAVIVEWVNNAVDSMVQAGKDPLENPVIVKIEDNKFSVEDKGIGLSREDFENICMSYLTSTKTGSNDYIGSFGLGMKSFMALERSATFTCRKDGKECVFLAYQGEEFMEYDLISEKNTSLENGVICEIGLNGWSEEGNFQNKAIQKLAYYDTVTLYIDGVLQENNIIRSENWQHSDNNSNHLLHLCLKDVYYKIDFEKLGIQNIHIPIALRFSLSEGLCPTPSRESLIWNESTIKTVKAKIKLVADWFVNKYNSTVGSYTTFVDAYPFLNNHEKRVKIGEHDLKINSLLEYSSLSVKEPIVQGLKFQDGKYYKEKLKSFLFEYEIVSYYDKYGTYKTKRIYKELSNWVLFEKGKAVLTDGAPKGNIKEFLIKKYGRDVIFCTLSNKRTLKGKNQIYNSYVHILELSLYPKDTWRDRIKEFQKIESELIGLLIDETKVKNTKEFAEFVEEKKRLQALNRTPGDNNYKVLNKQKDEVTLSVGREGLGNKIVFEKKTFKLEDLGRQSSLFVYFTGQYDINEAKELAKITVKSNIKVCLIGAREFTRIPKLHNFKSMKQFISEKSKPFRRIATTWLIKDLEDTYHDVLYSKRDIIKDCIKTLDKDLEVLQEYRRKNGYSYTADERVVTAIEELAKEGEYYDMEIYPIYKKVKKELETFDFLVTLQKPNGWNEEEKKSYNRVIAQMLLFKKLYAGKFEDYELVKKT